MGYVVAFEDLDQTSVADVGGKGARLAELARIEGLRVPDGFCVTTTAFQQVLAGMPSLDERLDRLSQLRPDDRDEISALSAQLRQLIEGVEISGGLAAAISDALDRGSEPGSYAVRSSATAEDLPTASFAGQQDSYLNVVGLTSVLRHVTLCWASLFTERATIYRLRNGFDHRRVHMAVVVQRMVPAQAAGVLFTADPVSGDRRVVAVEASFGLGEGLVSGRTAADRYTVRDGAIDSELHEQPTLTEAQVLKLAELGRRIEAHFGDPQDIEWCLVDDDFHIVQARPITTLFPVPEVDDPGNHVFVSVGHQQMMTDAMKPLGLSVWQLTTPRPMAEGGSRLFVDVTQALAAPVSRANLLDALGNSDPLIGDALRTVLDRGTFIHTRPDAGPDDTTVSTAPPVTVETDPAIVTELIEHSQASVATLQRDIQTKHGTALFDFILADIAELRRILFGSTSHQVIVAGMEATQWLNEHLHAWLGEKNAADALTQSVPHNVTAEMGLALLDVADAMRDHPDVVTYLQNVAQQHRTDAGFLAELAGLAGGIPARQALSRFLDAYGMRCAGEIDITRPRWSECPAPLVPTILANIETFEPGAAKRRFEEGRRHAADTAHALLTRLRALPDGEHKAEQTERMIERVRTFAGYREYPKYTMVSRYFIYKQALLKEAARLVENQVLRDKYDIFYLRFHEFREVVRTNAVDDRLIPERKQAFRSHRALTPPRVITSDGEIIVGTYRRDDPPSDALVGLAVSAGVAEGRARVVLDMADAQLDAGDILVTAYTDPSWTPLFVGINGLVTEVGGLMTHGAVIAREYGLPAVIGVENATTAIRDGQRIRVHGTDGYVEILD